METTVTSAWTERIARTETAIELLRARGVVHRTSEDLRLDGRHVELGGTRIVNFGSCSYLGLETDGRLKLAAAEAVDRFGAIFASSRAYLSVPLFSEFESLLSKLSGGHPIVVAPSTTLAHQAALPVLVEDGDAVCFDVLSHQSLQAVLPVLRQRGIPCEPIPHQRFDLLERRVRRLAQDHRQVFFLCDGVYSMHGDLLDVRRLFELLEHLPSLVAYVDDAHGVGWAGERGAGIVLGERGLHPRMVVVLGLAKGFASGGAVIAFPNQELARRVFGCGGPLIFSGPLHPAQLGAGIASARIHLSPELTDLQRRLCARVLLFDELAASLGIAPFVPSRSPIRFFEVGDDQVAAAVAGELLARGFFVNPAVFPAVARGRAGIRLMLNCRHTPGDIEALARELAASLQKHATKRPAVVAGA